MTGGTSGRSTGRAVRFGFLGAGWIASRALAPAVHAADGATLQAVAARDLGRAAALEPEGRYYDDYAAVVADPDVDVVYVALSNEAHRPWTLAALQAGNHVLCEKPLGLDATEVAEITAMAVTHDRLAVEAFWYRWHPRTLRLEHLLAEGVPGRILGVETDFTFLGDYTGEFAGNYRLEPARGGGALYDVGCYAVSGAHLAVGPELTVEKATATLGETGVDLATSATLRVPGGVHAGAGAVVACGIAAPPRQVFRVEGEDAVLELPGDEAFTSWNRSSTLEIREAGGTVRVETFAPVDPYRRMVEAVAARVRGEDAFVVPLDHSAQVVTTLDAVRTTTAATAGSTATAGE